MFINICMYTYIISCYMYVYTHARTHTHTHTDTHKHVCYGVDYLLPARYSREARSA
jgi:hypothetical protein